MTSDPGADPVTVAVFGLGEAGSEISADLATAGARVSAFDPAPVPDVEGVERVDRPTEAVLGADVVLAITAAAEATDALGQALHRIPSGTVYADLSTSAARLKVELARTAEAAGLAFVDVALMSTVPGKGLATPALASGPGAADLARLLGPLGSRMEVIGARAGLAATRKLLRSVVVKGLAGIVIESMRAATAAGLETETWDNLVEEFTAMDEGYLRRLVRGTQDHAPRRHHEMEAAVRLLRDLGVDPVMTSATVEHLRRVPAEGVPATPDGAQSKS